MTRAHAARQLLALGPLSFGQFVTFTGWPSAACRRVLSYLVDDLGEVSRKAGIYRIEDGKELRDMPALEAEGKQTDGSPEVRDVRHGRAVGVLSADALVRKAQIGRFGCGCGACGLAGEGVSA